MAIPVMEGWCGGTMDPPPHRGRVTERWEPRRSLVLSGDAAARWDPISKKKLVTRENRWVGTLLAFYPALLGSRPPAAAQEFRLGRFDLVRSGMTARGSE